jgi:hypothetical protein
MKHIRVITLSLVAVFALCAVAASSASATEILFALPTGHNFPVTFTSKAGSATLETVGGIKIKCSSVSNNGTILSAHLGDVLVRFLGCKDNILNGKCKSPGAQTEEIHIKEAVFHLGLEHTSTGNHAAILFLLPEEPAGSGTHQFTFECGGANVTVTGDVIGLLEQLNGEPLVPGNFYTSALVLFKQSGGVQAGTEFLLSLTSPENELMTGQHLTSTSSLFGTEESAEEVTDELENYSSGEIGLVEA